MFRKVLRFRRKNDYSIVEDNIFFLFETQVYSSVGEQERGDTGSRRGMAQLSSCLPLGLQNIRTRWLLVQFHEGLHRFLRQNRLGLRSQDRLAGHGEETRRTNRRRYPRSLGMGRQRPDARGARRNDDSQPHERSCERSLKLLRNNNHLYKNDVGKSTSFFSMPSVDREIEERIEKSGQLLTTLVQQWEFTIGGSRI